MDEFLIGECQCGAIYVSEPTGFNVGAAMVECMVAACDDNPDLAWELEPDVDYLSSRLEDYDEVTHYVYESREHEGRRIGVAIRPTAGSRRPIFVSPGHRVNLAFSECVVRRLILGRRLPEPLYWADRLSRRAGREGV